MVFRFSPANRCGRLRFMQMRLAAVMLVTLGLAAFAEEKPATGRIEKVLPLRLDKQGRSSLSPSLIDRDAYQARLLQQPELQSGYEFAVNWKAKAPPSTTNLTLRIELRGGRAGKPPATNTLEQAVSPGGGLFGKWTSLKLVGEDYKRFGQVAAWRATLCQGTNVLAEQQSFLWSGQPPGGPVYEPVTP
jgi:hypothetical protein